MARAIDAMAVPATPAILKLMGVTTLNEYAGGEGAAEAEFVSQMDRAGIEAVIVPATRTHVPPRWIIPAETIKDLCDRHPGRFFGLVGADVFEPENSLRDVVRAIEQYGFRGIYIYPHRMKVPPNSPLYDPFYSMARKLEVPVVMQIGNSFRDLNATKAMMEAVQRHDLDSIRESRGWYCHPAYLHDVCERFPDVRIVASHAGWPWTRDLVDLMTAYPNLFTDTSVYYPEVWEDFLVDFIKGPGSTRVLWGTNYPEVQWQPALQQIDALGLSPQVSQRLVRDNAMKLYRLDA